MNGGDIGFQDSSGGNESALAQKKEGAKVQRRNTLN